LPVAWQTVTLLPLTGNGKPVKSSKCLADAVYQFTAYKSDKETDSKVEKISITAPELNVDLRKQA